MPIRIAPEASSDRGAVDLVHLASFPSSAEADLVAALRSAGDLTISLVATDDGAVVGHVAMSPVCVEGSSLRAFGLAPVAVLPAYRRRAVGSALVREALEACRNLAASLVVVLGDPGFYGRFGFENARQRGHADTFGGGDAFQCIRLDPALPPGGVVHYASAFDALRRAPAPEPPPLALIAAVAENGAIGRGGQVPWDYPDDRAFFETTTRGHAVIMGRRTWEESGRPLPGRFNIVVARAPFGAVLPSSVRHVTSLAQAVALARSEGKLPLVIGGSRLYAEALPEATRFYQTAVPETPVDADTFFPPLSRELAVVASWHGTQGEAYRILRAPPPFHEATFTKKRT